MKSGNRDRGGLVVARHLGVSGDLRVANADHVQVTPQLVLVAALEPEEQRRGAVVCRSQNVRLGGIVALEQQASYDRARDRALLKEGLPTIRFTGSDIHRDAEQCAIEIIEVAEMLIQEHSRMLDGSNALAALRRGRMHATVHTTANVHPSNVNARESILRVRIRESILRVVRIRARESKNAIYRLTGGNRAAVMREIDEMLVDGALELCGGAIILPARIDEEQELQRHANADEKRAAYLDALDMVTPSWAFEIDIEEAA